jgi:hypothetical protein
MGDWVVVLEFSAFGGERPFELGLVQAVVERLREWHASGLYNPDRYAVQLHLAAEEAAEALKMAVAYHDLAVQAVGADAVFSRAEVLTLGEFEASWHDDGQSAARGSRSGAAQAMISLEVYEATRALLGASTPPEVTDILVRFVLAIGGQVNVGPPRPRLGTVCVDLSGAANQELHAVADSFSVAGLIIERWLPPLIDDAKRTLELLERSH